MRFSVGLAKEGAAKRLEQRGISRREFMKFCTTVAVAMGMGPAFAPQVAKALTAPKRPSVVYLHGQECTGCSESILRTVKPYIDELILDTISLDYHETIMAAAGEAAEDALHKAISSPEGYICVMEGGIPTAQNGIFCKIGNRTLLDMVNEILPKAKAVIAYGTCAAFGGVQAAKPNPTGAKGVDEIFKDLHPINIGGCPPNPYNFVGTVVYFLKNGKAPELDSDGRPTMFFGESVHDLCQRRKHFDNEEFAPAFNSKEARDGWCLYNLGCKGPVTFNNCPKIKFNQTNWPVQAGHPCIGCSERGFWDNASPFYQQ